MSDEFVREARRRRMGNAEVLPARMSCRRRLCVSRSFSACLPGHGMSGYPARIQLCLDYLHRSQLSRGRHIVVRHIG